MKDINQSEDSVINSSKDIKENIINNSKDIQENVDNKNNTKEKIDQNSNHNVSDTNSNETLSLESNLSSPKTLEEVVSGKNEFKNNTSTANGNIAQNQQIIQNAVFYGNNANQTFGIQEVNQNFISLNNKSNKKYDLSDAAQFAKFGERYKSGEYFAVAIIVCVFEYVLLDDLQYLKTKLFDYLPVNFDDEGKEIAIHKDFYISINNILTIINVKMFTIESGENCIGLGDIRSLALKNLWNQFPSLRENIVKWLLNVSQNYEYKTGFRTYQVLNSFINLIKLDFSAGINHIFSKMYSNSNNDWFLGLIGYELYNDPETKNKILPILSSWTVSKGNWLWKPACFIYANIKNDDKDDNFDKKIYQDIKQRFLSFDWQDLKYIGLLLTGSERLRTLISVILNKLISDVKLYEDKNHLVNEYIWLVNFSYYTISDKYSALPLFACDTKKQLYNIQPIIKALLSNYINRKFFYNILEAYFHEISSYDINNTVLNHIKAFWVLTIENNPQFRNDIILMLKRCNCRVSKLMLSFLNEIKYVEV